MMRAAIYARKSNEQNVSEDAKSVVRQEEMARAFAAKQAWTVANGRVYADDGVSGAEFVNREGLNALLAATNARPRPFDVLVTMAPDRMGREQYAMAAKFLELVEAGVRVFFYSNAQELKLDSPVAKFMLSAQGFAAEDYRYQVQVKTREALRAKAQKGHVTGGKALGYAIIAEQAGVKRYRIVPEQAEIVRRIFQLAAQG